MGNVEKITFNRAIRSRTTHQSFFHAFRNLQTILSLSRVHSLLQPQRLDNSFPPSYDREKKTSFSKTRDHSKPRMSPHNSALTLFLLLVSLPAIRMTPTRNAKTQVRIALLSEVVFRTHRPPARWRGERCGRRLDKQKIQSLP